MDDATTVVTVVSDEQAAARAQEGDVEAFGILVERFEAKLLRYARRFLLDGPDAEDAVQTSFLKAFENLRGYDTKRKFSSWLYRIAHNECIDAVRRRKREPLPPFDFDALLPHAVAPERTDRDAELRDLRESLEKHLNRMSPLYREPLILRYFDEMSYEDIADVLRIPVSTVGVRLKRGRDALQKLIER